MQSQRAAGSNKLATNRNIRLWVLPALMLAAGSGYYWQARSDTPPKPAVSATVRTARVSTGAVERTIRLTGSTAPERFSSLLAPQLRGGRHGASTGSFSRGGGGSSSGSSRSSGGGSSSGSSSSSAASAASSSGSQGGSSGAAAGTGGSGAAGGLSSAASSSMRSAVSRFSTPRTSSASRSASRSIVGEASLDLGSTASSLPGAGGGGGGGGPSMGGMGDFNLTLQSLIKPGARVKKGETIAEFDRQYMLNRLDDFRASQQQLEASLASLKANLEVEKKAHNQTIESAKAALDKARLDLKTVPVRSANDTERLRLAEEEAAANYKRVLNEVKFKDASQAAQLKIAFLERDQQKVELQRYEANVDRMVIKAPMEGLTVMGTTLRGSELGQIQAGDLIHPGMMMMRIVDPSSMVVNANANQADIEQIHVGSKARVRFDAYPDLELPAHVYSIGAISKNVGAGFRASYVKEVPVVVRLDKMDPRVIPDLSVSIDVVLGAENNAVIAPLESVFQEGASTYVFVRGPEGWQRRDVDLGLRNHIAAVVRSGLRAGEVIAAERPLAEKKK